MNVLLKLSPEEYSELAERADAADADVSDYVRGLLRRQMGMDPADAEPGTLDLEQWKRAFHSWLATHRSRNPNFDDSREGLYYNAR